MTGATVVNSQKGMKLDKPKKRKTKFYFGPEQESAVRIFLTATTYTERNDVYNKFLYAPLNTMIDSIIRRYKLYRKGIVFEDIHADTLSFLITKAEKFKPAKGKKAYSYFGTICKNYLMGQIIKDTKETNRNLSYEDISTSVQNRPDQMYYMKEEEVEASEIIKRLVVDIENFMNTNELTTNEHKIGLSLIEVFTNFETIFQYGSGNKFNKNLILLNLREMTNLTTKEIRSALKKYKLIYQLLVKQVKD